MFFPYLLLFFILIIFCILIFFNFKNYNNNENIKKDLNEIKKDEVYQKIIKKNTEQVNIEGVISITKITENIEQLTYSLQEEKDKINNEDLENKILILEQDTKILIDENFQLNIKLEQIKKEIENLLNGVMSKSYL